MSQDLEFVEQLRGMAGSTPDIAVPGVGTIVRAGRSRVARRNSLFTSAFGVVLLAGAGISTMPHTGLVGPGASVQPVAAMSQVEQVAPARGLLLAPGAAPESDAAVADAAVESAGVSGPSVESPIAAIAPLDQALEYSVSDYPADDAATVEAAGANSDLAWSPWATGLGIAGTASLATAAGLALRSRKLAPASVRIRNY